MDFMESTIQSIMDPFLLWHILKRLKLILFLKSKDKKLRNKVKKILNEWRKFLIKESSFAPKVPYSDSRLEPNYSLYVYEDSSSYYLVLYRKEKYVDDFYIIGYAAIHLLSKSGDKNCIPKTYHMTNI